jgi:hypothetical protein
MFGFVPSSKEASRELRNCEVVTVVQRGTEPETGHFNVYVEGAHWIVSNQHPTDWLHLQVSTYARIDAIYYAGPKSNLSIPIETPQQRLLIVEPSEADQFRAAIAHARKHGDQ